MYFLWRSRDGAAHWQYFSADQEHTIPAHAQELAACCDPATFIMIPDGTDFWLHKSLHGGVRNVFGHPYAAASTAAGHTGTAEPISEEQSPYGWLRPDGRMFHCDVGGHRRLALILTDMLRGSEPAPKDPEIALERRGWVKIFKNPLSSAPVELGHGTGCAVTDAQLEALTQMGYDEHTPGFARLLEADQTAALF